MTFHEKNPNPCLDDDDDHYETIKAVNNVDNTENRNVIDYPSSPIDEKCIPDDAETDHSEIKYRKKVDSSEGGEAPVLPPLPCDDQEHGHAVVDKPLLLELREAPAHLRFNKYVLSYYRPPLDIRGCIASLTYWHNETINILTHAVPVLFIGSLIPWMLPWDKINIPWLPVIHVSACIAPWVGSTLYHLFMCHQMGKVAYIILLKLDLIGIWFTQTFGALVTICAAIHCFEYETKRTILTFYLFICILCLYQAMTVSTVWGRRFAFTAPFSIRVLCLLLRLSSWGGGAPNTTYYVIMQDLLAIMGGYIGAVNIPEKWFPGKVDLVFNSHHIMHVLVVAAVYQMHKAAELDLVWMSSGSACHNK